MKLIITESQYNKVYKLDDVYDGLDPYYRRRINFINIKSNIDERIGYMTTKVLKNDSRGLVEHLKDIIHNVAWETIPYEWAVTDEDKLVTYVYEMMDRINKKYGEYLIQKLKDILEDENNNN